MGRAGRYGDLGMTCARPLSSWPSGTAFTRDVNTILIRRLDSRRWRQRALLWGLTTHYHNGVASPKLHAQEKKNIVTLQLVMAYGLWLYPNGLRGLLTHVIEATLHLGNPLSAVGLGIRRFFCDMSIFAYEDYCQTPAMCQICYFQSNLGPSEIYADMPRAMHPMPYYASCRPCCLEDDSDVFISWLLHSGSDFTSLC